MKIDLRVRELVADGVQGADRDAFAQRLQQELERCLADGGADGAPTEQALRREHRHIESRTVTRDCALERAADAAPDVARAVQREINR